MNIVTLGQPQSQNTMIIVIVILLIIAAVVTLYFLSKPSELTEWSKWDEECPVCATKESHTKKRTRELTPAVLLGGLFFSNKNKENEEAALEDSFTCDLMPCPVIIKPSMFTIVGNVKPVIITDSTTVEYDLKSYKLSKSDITDLDVKEILLYQGGKDATKANHISYTFNIFKKGNYTFTMKYKSPDSKSNSWYVKMDEGEWEDWNTPVSTELGDDEKTIYLWANRRAKTIYALEKGSHTIYIAPREPGSAMNLITMEYK